MLLIFAARCVFFVLIRIDDKCSFINPRPKAEIDSSVANAYCVRLITGICCEFCMKHDCGVTNTILSDMASDLLVLQPSDN